MKKAWRETTRLLTQPQARDETAISIKVSALQIIQELASLIDELKQTSARMNIGLMDLEMIAKPVDSRGEQCNLNFGGSGVLR